jgi:putative heme-binding domain-containing protein
MNRLFPLLVTLVLPAAARAAESGEQIYTRACAGCHGPRGEGGRGPTLAQPKLVRAVDRPSLMAIIEDGIDGTEMPDARLSPPQAKLVAEFVRKLGRRPPEKVPGDPARGRELYFGKAACHTCHTIAGDGGTLGNDLTDIGLRRGASHLRESLLDPEASLHKSTSPYREDITLTQNFVQVRLRTRAGQEISGARVNEDTFSIQVRDVTNRIHSFWKSELAELHKEWGRSPMPSYREALTPTELDDVVAFMTTLRGGK